MRKSKKRFEEEHDDTTLSRISVKDPRLKSEALQLYHEQCARLRTRPEPIDGLELVPCEDGRCDYVLANNDVFLTEVAAAYSMVEGKLKILSPDQKPCGIRPGIPPASSQP